MASSAAKPSTSAAAGGRRKSAKSKIVSLKLSPKALQAFPHDATPKPAVIKDEPSAAPTPVAATSASSPDANVPGSNANTPAPSAAGASALMPPPTEAVKRKGKRTAAEADLTPKVRGKPGPKKKPRKEDGSIDHKALAQTSHKLGPKANQGAINAGLRALDRTGKPCRKWQKGGFVLKSFTGVVWEIPRWSAPPKVAPNTSSQESTSSGDSSKENKDSTGVRSDKSTSAPVADQGPSMPASSPAPMMAVTAAFS